MISKVNSLGVFGCQAYAVEIEVDLSSGLPGISIVGLPDQAVKESRDRIKPAIKNSGLPFPNRRITVNLAPAEIKKEGPSFDLPIALGLLAAANVGIAPEALKDYAILGELSLEGEVRRVRGVLPMAIFARDGAVRRLIVPAENAAEAAVIETLEVYPVRSLAEAVGFLKGELRIERFRVSPERIFERSARPEPDFSEVRGQELAKRALEVAVAGGHNVLFIGPPGTGKTMLARRVVSILPPFTLDEAVETSQVYSLVGLLPESGLLAERPFRAPHHTVSDVALIGGGQIPRPGEVSLAHNGVLFLDELPEFDRNTLEVLRQPLEEGVVHISRARSAVSFPASFMFIAAMNPCPCGNLGHPRKACRCAPAQIQKYRSRLSGPLLDRIDLQIEVPPVTVAELSDDRRIGESSRAVRERVASARRLQRERYRSAGILNNSQLAGRRLKEFGRLEPEAESLLNAAVDKFELSARVYDRLRKVARTIADLEASGPIQSHHISEALQYRTLDRKVWI
ncbi:MAG TPA: YifB family Mg chelatase-like AAA ATPase [bacterium]|nr:YifB family Mg chelatase-like AAA ATPase [bacterium]HNS47991.1 YifB family Mg chelatase-like AAA ATPase [bacterium]